jgi:tRNA-Thr(GGU) m(6)t(6)A37 methyltransferase TsaA
MAGEITFQTIGIIHTQFLLPEGTPISTFAGCGVKGTVELFPKFVDGLQDIEGFSHLILIYHMNQVTKKGLTGIPFMHDKPHGVFAMRSPMRPNNIGISIVRLSAVRRNLLEIEDLDILDATPLLDIKPYIPQVDSRTDCRTGWFEGDVEKMKNTRDDGRYSRG